MHSARASVPPTVRTLPAATSQRGPLASKMGPICRPQKKARKMYTLKIQPTASGEVSASWCALMYAWRVPTVFMMPKPATMPQKEPRTTSQARRPPSG